MDLDNHCIVEYLDGTREDIICSWARERKPAFRSAGDGAIIVEYHNMQRRSIPIARVRSWRFTYGDTITINDISMTCVQERRTFQGMSYMFVYFSNGDLKEVLFSAGELDALVGVSKRKNS